MRSFSDLMITSGILEEIGIWMGFEVLKMTKSGCIMTDGVFYCSFRDVLG